MTFDITVPTLIGRGANPPAYSPTGGAVVVGSIGIQDLARGVAIYANRFEGGQQVVRSVMDVHCSSGRKGLQFLAFTEEEAYGYLQYKPDGTRIDTCLPVVTLRKTDVLSDARIDLLVEAFGKKAISIEYVMGGKDNGIYSDEIDRLVRKLINAEVGDYVLVFDQSDSVMMRRRHGSSEPHIRAITDLLSRQHPRIGFISNGTGPGNAIIEAVRRAEIFVGKKLTTYDKIYGFAGVTHKAVFDNWERGFGYQNVAIEHAWKHARAGQGSPELLDLPTASAILDGDRSKIALVDSPVVSALRKAMSKAKSKNKGKGKKGVTTSSTTDRTVSAQGLQSRRGGLCASTGSLMKQDGYTYRNEVCAIAGLMVRHASGHAIKKASSYAIYSKIKSTPSIQKAAAFANACQRKIAGVFTVAEMGMLHVAIVKQDDAAATAYLLGIAGRPGGSAEGIEMRKTLEAMGPDADGIARYEAAYARWVQISASTTSNIVTMHDAPMRMAA